MFERRHYEAMAKMIGATQSKVLNDPKVQSSYGFDITLASLVELFEQDNPNFDTERFLDAVAIWEEEITCTNTALYNQRRKEAEA